MTTLDTAKAHFQRVDPVVAAVVAGVTLPAELAEFAPTEYFGRLCDDIISQQLSIKAAATIGQRFVDFYQAASAAELDPHRIKSTDPLQLRQLGLSMNKARYVIGLAEAVASGQLDFARFTHMSDEEIIEHLVAIKGVGRWTAEMFLIFTMGRQNIFSWGDLGLKRSLYKLYGEEYANKPVEAQAIVENWSPFKSYASLALWRWQDAS
jgi:DNA-3-methyladenine glycosylase II